MNDAAERLMYPNKTAMSSIPLSFDNFFLGENDTLAMSILNGSLGAGTLNSFCTNLTSPGNLSNYNFTTADILNCTATAILPSQKYLLYEFIVNGFGITVVAILGIIGNILSAIVLSRPQMRSSVTCLLLGLAFCDSLLVFTSTLIFGLCSLSAFMGTLATYRHVYHPLWVPYLYPISVSAQTASVYLTLAVTLERYVAVCHPLRARSLCTWRRARYCVMTVLLFAITYNLPRWWEVRTVKGFNLTLNMTVYENYMSPMRANALYIKIYINWAYLVVMYLVPFTGLVAFNLAIYRQVRKANRERQVLSKLQRREMGLATMLLCVVVVFLMCNVLPLVINILESFYSMSIDHLVQTSNFLVVFNSSVNFVIYCTCGERFRRLLLRLCRDFLWCRLGLRSSRRNSLYRKSHLYRGQHDSSYFSIVHRLASGDSGTGVNGSLRSSFLHDQNRNNRRSEMRKPVVILKTSV